MIPQALHALPTNMRLLDVEHILSRKVNKVLLHPEDIMAEYIEKALYDICTSTLQPQSLWCMNCQTQAEMLPVIAKSACNPMQSGSRLPPP